MSQGMWLIIGPQAGMGWLVVEVIDYQSGVYACALPEGPEPEAEFISQPRAAFVVQEGGYVAKHTSEAEAKEAVKRAKAAEQQVRPFWQEAVAMEIRFRQLMSDTAHVAAQPTNSLN